MGNVLGIGGVFFKCADPEATKNWYIRVLGMTAEDYGGFHFSHAQSAEAKGPGALTVFSGFAGDTDYFSPSEAPFMFNLMVDDLDAVLAHAAAEGVEPVQPGVDEEYGRFAWIMDPDGRKVELWQPPG
ncbi:MAG: VOC family protein [Pseudomonadota bacterium]